MSSKHRDCVSRLQITAVAFIFQRSPFLRSAKSRRLSKKRGKKGGLPQEPRRAIRLPREHVAINADICPRYREARAALEDEKGVNVAHGTRPTMTC